MSRLQNALKRLVSVHVVLTLPTACVHTNVAIPHSLTLLASDSQRGQKNASGAQHDNKGHLSHASRDSLQLVDRESQNVDIQLVSALLTGRVHPSQSGV